MLEDVDKIYLDTNCLLDWIVRLMKGDKTEPELIEFIRSHSEIKY